MGICGLHKQLKFCTKQGSVREFQGQRLTVDASSWLHKSVYSISEHYVEKFEEARDRGGQIDDAKCVNISANYILNRCKELNKSAEITKIILVMDGKRCPLKASTNNDRETRRQANLTTARELKRRGLKSEAEEKYKSCIKIGSAFTKNVMKRLNYRLKWELPNDVVEFVWAPYEADAQMVKVCMDGRADAIVTEDSDVLVYLASCDATFPVLFKLERQSGRCNIISMDWLLNGMEQQEASQRQKKDKFELIADSLKRRQDKNKGHGARLFVQAACLAGCDYSQSLPGVGLMTAFDAVRNNAFAGDVFNAVVRWSLPKKAKRGVSDQYKEVLSKSEAVFYYHPVEEQQSGGKRKIKFLNPPTKEPPNKYLPNLHQFEDITFLGSEEDLHDLALEFGLSIKPTMPTMEQKSNKLSVENAPPIGEISFPKKRGLGQAPLSQIDSNNIVQRGSYGGEEECTNIIQQAGPKKRKTESPLDYFLYCPSAYKGDNDVRGVGRKIDAARSSTVSQLERSQRKVEHSTAMAKSDSFSQATNVSQRKIVKIDNPYRKSRPVKTGITSIASKPNNDKVNICSTNPKCSDIESCTSCEPSATRQRDMIAVKLTKSEPARNNFATTGDLAMGETQNEVSVSFQYKLESDTDDADEEVSDVHVDPPSREADKMISSQEDDLTEASGGDDQRLQSRRPNKNNNTSSFSSFQPRLPSARLSYGATKREATNRSMPTATGTMKTRDPRWSRHNFSGHMSEASSVSEDAGDISTHPSQRPRLRHSPVDNDNVRLSGDQLQATKIHTGGAATSKYFLGRRVRKVSLESKPSLDFGDDDESISDASSQKEDYDTQNHDHHDEAAQQNNVSSYKNSDPLSPPRAPPRPPHQNSVAAHRQVHYWHPKVRRKSQPSPPSQEASKFHNKNNGCSTQPKPKKKDRNPKKTSTTARKGTIQHGFNIHKEHSNTPDSVLTVSSKSMKHLICRGEQAEAKAKRILSKRKKGSTLLDYGYKKQLVIRINERGDDDF